MDEEMQTTEDIPHLLVHGEEGDEQKHVVANNLAEAIAYAEYLANEYRDETARIFEMRELSIAFKPYYQVHVDGTQPVAPAGEPYRVGLGVAHPKVVPISA